MNRFNYVPPEDDHLPASFQGSNDPGELPIRKQLYNDYALPYESIEDFVDRMSEDYGEGWISKLISKTKNLKK